MCDFKVGDKVRYVCSDVHAIVLGVGDEMLFVKVSPHSGTPYETATSKELWEHAISTPTPPEGREVEGEMRHAKRGDEYWDGKGWPRAMIDIYGDYYCLRPLPPKPEGEGWEWRRRVKGDEVQTLNGLGGPDRVLPFEKTEPCQEIRLGYRWCRAKPKVKRWQQPVGISGVGTVPYIDDGTGPRLDEDKIVEDKWRAKAIEWLEEKSDYASAKHFADILREEAAEQAAKGSV